MANPLRMRCKLISTNVEKKLFIFILRKQVKFKKKSLFRRLIKLIASDEDIINFSESFNLAANKKHERCPKNQIEKKND